MNWNDARTLVTGGTSFIGSHLIEGLAARGATVRVLDNLSSGRKEYLARLIAEGRVELLTGDLLDQETARRGVRNANVVFHVAVDHGGRGYVDLHQSSCATNLALDGLLFRAAFEAGVEKVVYASSGCFYPKLSFRGSRRGPVSRREGSRRHGDDRPGVHQTRSFVVWGNDEQIRNWTHVNDIVEGTIRAAEHIDDGTAVNLRTMERTRVLDAVHELMAYTGHEAQIELHPQMSTGPMNRVADDRLAMRLMGWEPRVSFKEGLHQTIDWYYSTTDSRDVAQRLESSLTER